MGKFAKLEVLSHHGTEHYCPISMFKVLAFLQTIFVNIGQFVLRFLEYQKLTS